MAFTHPSLDEAFGPKPLPLVGNHACLNFVNSLNPRKGDPQECLHSYTDLIRWGVYAALVSHSEADKLSALAVQHQTEAEAVFRRAISLREMLFRLFYAASQGGEVPETEATTLRGLYAEALPHARLMQAERSFEWVWPGDRLETPLYRLAHDAVELLRTGDPARFKACANPVTCGWLFYDTSKNNSRRWCRMAECGVADKVRQQRRRRAKTAKN